MTDNPARAAAVAAVLPRVQPGMTLGLGSGRAVFALADAIVAKWPDGGGITAVAASPQTEDHLSHAGIPVIDLTADVTIDLAIDGADEVDPDLGLIKGGGAALLREKLLITAAQHVLIVAESRKRVQRLGETFRLPVEIVRFGWETTRQRVLQLVPDAPLRMNEDGTPVVTDENHYLLDVTIPEGNIAELAFALKATLGVVEHGLFLTQADEVILGNDDGTATTLTR